MWSVSDRPWGLRVEHFDDALGIDTMTPRLSWKLPPISSRQIAFQVRTPEWHTGRVDSPDSVLVPYEGPSLRSRQRVDWQVKVWTDQGESDWSAPASWEMGLLSAREWIARWIEPLDGDRDGEPGQRR